MRDIALAGGMGAGKSEVARYLTRHYGYASVKISQPIYEIAAELWGYEAATDRAKLQDLGEKMREIDPDVWINYYVDHLKDFPDDPVVNDTLRFPNEYWALRNVGFVMVRVLAPEATRVDRLQKIGRIQDLDRLHHISETALIGAKAESQGIHFDYEIHNDTDKNSLGKEIARLMKSIEEEE